MLNHTIRRKNGGIQCALICALCAAVSFIPFLFQNGGFFHVWSDFNWQQVPFGMAVPDYREWPNSDCSATFC